MKVKQFFALAVFYLSVSNSYGAIILSGSPDAAGDTGTLTFNTDITFDIQTTSTVYSLGSIVFDEWVAADGNVTQLTDSPVQSLTYSVDNGANQTTSIQSLTDNFDSPMGDITANDGALGVSNVELIAGQTFTIKAGSYTFAGNDSFNSDAIGSFTGSIFLVDQTGNRISNIVVVPEPSTYAAITGACLLCAGTLLRLRRSNHK